MRTLLRFLVVVLVSAVVTSAGVVLLAPQVGAVLGANRSAQVNAIDLDPLAQRSVVLAADGSELAVLHGEQNRKVVPLDEVPQVVVDTILAVEDEQFFEHGGLNARATMRALLTNVAAGDLRQGGSTITQQLVKNSLLTPKQDLDRKVREAVLAVRLEEQFTKREILERYLNTVYLGNGAYGVQAAAELYFGKDVAELGRAEAAFLTGLIQYPSGYDPYRFPDDAVDRRNEVVDRLLAVEQIDEAEAAELRAAPIPTERHELKAPKDHFVDEVVQRLLADERLGEDRDERSKVVFEGGLTIRTTLDPIMQFGAAKAISENLPDSGGRFTAAVVSVEPSTGAVRALVGGQSFDESKYNVVTGPEGRQPGSSFKPFVLAAHLEHGGSGLDNISGVGPCSFPNPGAPDPTWTVSNFGNSRGGHLDLRRAVTTSNNCAFARLGIHVGIDKVIETAKSLGLKKELPHSLALSLGAGEVRPIDMAAAYATFANGGMYNEPYFIQQVLDRDGKALIDHQAEPRRAISESTAAVVSDFLVSNVQGGTGTRARFPDGRAAGGKTGTTQNHADAWFVGSIPQMTTAVWMGSPVNRESMRNVGGRASVTGGSFPAQIWGAYMHPTFAAWEHQGFAPVPPQPPGSQVLLPGERAAMERRQAAERRRAAAEARRRPTFMGGSQAPSAPAPRPAPPQIQPEPPPLPRQVPVEPSPGQGGERFVVPDLNGLGD